MLGDVEDLGSLGQMGALLVSSGIGWAGSEVPVLGWGERGDQGAGQLQEAEAR